MIYMDTGSIINVRISGGEYAMASVNGAAMSVRHFIVTGATSGTTYGSTTGKFGSYFASSRTARQSISLLQDATVAAGTIRSHP